LRAENHNAKPTDIPMKDQGVARSFIRIEDDCWLGAGCMVLAGVAVGRGSIVAAGAVATKDLPPGSVVGGVPACIFKQRGDMSAESQASGVASPR
jgi:acetyltransferase-like isoleucine patch superfamily enzyme